MSGAFGKKPVMGKPTIIGEKPEGERPPKEIINLMCGQLKLIEMMNKILALIEKLVPEEEELT